MAFWDRNKNSQGLRVIKTARDADSINKAAKSGFKPLIKKVEPSDNIRSKYAVVQNKKTGEIAIAGDYRADYAGDNNDFETVIDWTFYYPYSFKSPFAAYLIPSILKKSVLLRTMPMSIVLKHSGGQSVASIIGTGCFARIIALRRC